MQCNRSDSKPGVLKGLHYHHNQIDYWYVPIGRPRAALVDIRQHSPTYLNTYMVEMGEENEIGLYIPSGVAHGFIALTDVTLTYTSIITVAAAKTNLAQLGTILSSISTGVPQIHQFPNATRTIHFLRIFLSEIYPSQSDSFARRDQLIATTALH